MKGNMGKLGIANRPNSAYLLLCCELQQRDDIEVGNMESLKRFFACSFLLLATVKNRLFFMLMVFFARYPICNE
jgi:hypothetical protein